MAETAITCAFCGLACDDLVAEGSGAVETRGCATAAAGFARGVLVTQARIAGRPVAHAEAVEAAAHILRQARLPLFTGLGVDLEGIRAVLALADRTGGIVDRWRSAAASRNLAVIQRSGALTASFGEVANRGDVVLLVGRDPTPDFPRFFERLIDNSGALYRTGRPWVAYLGPAELAPAEGRVREHITVDAAHLLDALSALAAAIGGSAAGDGQIAALAQRLGTARYGVIVWDAAGLEQGDLAVDMMLHVIRRLTLKTRCVGLPLGGTGNAQGVAQAMLWQAGWPAQLSFARGIPEHDPWLYDAERLVAAGEVDALVWADALSATPPPRIPGPTIVLAPPDVTLPEPADVEIRVGIPGLDHAGTVMRADTVVALPLAAVRSSGLPSLASVAGELLREIARTAS